MVFDILLTTFNAINTIFMKLICPECKNDVDLSNYPKLEYQHIVECNHCGITLAITEINEGGFVAEVVDEGK